MLIATLPTAVIFAILLLAFMLDAAYGDPPWLYRRVPHPVALLGRVLEAAEVRWNRPGLGARARFLRGLLFVLAVVALAGGLGWAVERLCNGFLGGWVLEAVLASTLIAFRGLHDHVRAVAEALDLGLEDARAKVAHIVGRDPARLDQAGVARAATESLAENFSDGVVAPLFWFALFGLGGLCAYKAVNTLDSMIGYRNARFEAFGKAAARLDDAVNWVPARLAGLLPVAAALILPKASAGRAWRTMRRDAPRHRSSNAGWQEAAMAGALGFALAGPRHYPDGLVPDHWMGAGRAELGSADLNAALRLYLVASALVAGLLAAAWVAG
ncbi:MAG: cobalamin biosynthesis protein CobD [Proteobacteria bacterium]|nr:cobalamin biosynthesis protein CobD [Pseudomonadota bacterium]